MAIQARIRDMEGRLESEQTADARKRIQELNEQIKIIDNELGAVQTKLPKIENDLIALKKQRTELLGDIEGIKGVEKRLKVVEALVESLNRFIERLKSEKIDLVERRASEMMRRIFHKEGFIQQFKIESDAHSIRIRLLGADGVVVDFNTVSMGERQIVVTALLHALIHESHFSFPVFIDSPLQKLDALHRRGILEHFYVGLHTQTVLLPLLESELRTEEYELIRHHIDRCYLITHQDKASRFLPVGAAQLFDTYHHLQTSPTP